MSYANLPEWLLSPHELKEWRKGNWDWMPEIATELCKQKLGLPNLLAYVKVDWRVELTHKDFQLIQQVAQHKQALDDVWVAHLMSLV